MVEIKKISVGGVTYDIKDEKARTIAENPMLPVTGILEAQGGTDVTSKATSHRGIFYAGNGVFKAKSISNDTDFHSTWDAYDYNNVHYPASDVYASRGGAFSNALYLMEGSLYRIQAGAMVQVVQGSAGEGGELGEDVSIVKSGSSYVFGNGAVVGQSAQLNGTIATGANVGEGAKVGNSTYIGEGAKINGGVMIGTSKTGHGGVYINSEKEVSTVQEGDTFIGKNVTIEDNAKIGDQVEIGKQVYIEEGFSVDEGAITTPGGILNLTGKGLQSTIGGSVNIGDGVNIESNVTIKKGVVIGASVLKSKLITIGDETVPGNVSIGTNVNINSHFNVSYDKGVYSIQMGDGTSTSTSWINIGTGSLTVNRTGLTWESEFANIFMGTAVSIGGQYGQVKIGGNGPVTIGTDVNISAGMLGGKPVAIFKDQDNTLTFGTRILNVKDPTSKGYSLEIEDEGFVKITDTSNSKYVRIPLNNQTIGAVSDETISV